MSPPPVDEARATSDDAAFAEYDVIDSELTFVNDLYAAMPVAAQLQLVDSAPQEAGSVDPVGAYLDSASLRLTEVISLTAEEVAPALYEPAARPIERTKVMVIGDSASYGVAIELDHLAGDQLDVLWAGHHNCPLVPAVRIMVEGVEFPTDDCLKMQQQWPSVISQPDVLVRWCRRPSTPTSATAAHTWYHIGDARARCTRMMSSLLADVQPNGTTVLMANSSYSPSSARERVDAWNAQLAEWAERWAEVEMVDIAGPIADAEAAAGQSLRPDALHLDDATLQMIIRTVYLPAIDAAIDAT
jgi:hypothetical protein